MTNHKHCSVLLEGDVTVVQILAPKLTDSLAVTEFQDELLEMLERDCPTKVVVSFKGVESSSTAVINGLLRAKKLLLRNDGRLRLCGMNRVIRDAYRLLNLDGTVFDIDNTLAESLRAIQG